MSMPDRPSRRGRRSSKSNAAFAENFRQVRLAKGWTQLQAAEHLSVSEDRVGAWERSRDAPPYDELVRIADLLGESTDRLLKGTSASATVLEQLFREFLLHYPGHIEVNLWASNQIANVQP